jgi:hypothetical protein
MTSELAAHNAPLVAHNAPLTSRPATQDDEEAIAKLLLCMYEEVGRCPLNPQKACTEIVDTVTVTNVAAASGQGLEELAHLRRKWMLAAVRLRRIALKGGLWQFFHNALQYDETA